MTAFAPDLPDWTKQSSAGSLFVQEATLAPDFGLLFGLSGVASYLIRLQADGPTTGIQVLLSYFVDGLGADGLGQVPVSAYPSTYGSVGFQYESPSFGGSVLLTVADGGDPVGATVISSNRTVSKPRILNDLNCGNTFVFPNTDFEAGTPVQLQPIAATCAGVPANVVTAFQVESTDDGLLEFYYWDVAWVLRKILIATVTANVLQLVQVPLPQCVGQLYFTPATTDPAGAITVQSFPAYSG